MDIIRTKCTNAMEQMGITISDIVIATGLPDSTVRNALSDHSKAPSLQTMGPICAFLRVSIDDHYCTYRPGGMSNIANQRELDLYIKSATQAELIKNLRAELERTQRTIKALKTACAVLAVALILHSLVLFLPV